MPYGPQSIGVVTNVKVRPRKQSFFGGERYRLKLDMCSKWFILSCVHACVSACVFSTHTWVCGRVCVPARVCASLAADRIITI